MATPLPILRVKSPTPHEFRRHVAARTPVVIEGGLGSWRSRWSFERLSELAGEHVVRVQARKTERSNDFDYRMVKLAEFLAGLRAGRKTDYLASSALFDKIPALWDDVEVPSWLGAAHVLPRVFIGPEGALSSLHYDLAHGLTAQVEGRKHVACFEFRRRDFLRFPDLGRPGWVSEAFDDADVPGQGALKPARFWETVLEPGEIAFLPSRRHHVVRSLDASISVHFFWHDLSMRGVRWMLKRFGRLVM